MAETKTYTFEIAARNRTDAALAAVAANLDRVTSAASRVQSALGRGIAVATAIASWAEIVRATGEAEKASARLEATIRATGNAAKLSRAELSAMAEEMARSTMFDDEAVTNAQAQLMKFGGISGDVFRRTMAAAADLAAFLGTDLSDAAHVLGNAVNSPTEALGRLERQIGKVSAADRERIRTLEESGRVHEAQIEIISLIERRFGGLAREMNQGLGASMQSVKKTWDDLLEAFGKTEPVQSFGRFLAQSLRDVKEIVENGDWVEKLLAIAAFAGGWRGIRLTPQPEPPRGPEVRGIIGGAQWSQDVELTGHPMSERDIKAWMEMLEGRKRLAEQARRAAEQELEEYVRVQRQILEGEQEFAREAAEAQRIFTDAKLAEDRRYQELSDLSWREYMEAQHQRLLERDDLIRQIALAERRLRLDEEEKEARKLEDAARSLGLTFSSAFEDAVLAGKKLQDVLRGLALDVARIFVRKTVTEPLALMVSGWVKESGLLPGFAHGGEFTVGGAGGTDSQVVAFRATPGERVTVSPPAAAAGGGDVVINVVNNSGAAATVSERSDGGTRIVDVLIEHVAGALGRDIARGTGLAPVLERRYGLSAAAGALR